MLLGAPEPASSTLQRRNTLGAPLLLLAVAYYFGVRIGLAFTLPPNAVSLLWPTNAILLAALLLSPPRDWGWLLLAVLPAHLIAELSAGVPLLMASCWYMSNVSEALLGATIIHRLLGAPRFDRVHDASIYLFAAVLVAPVLTSVLDAGLVALVGYRYDGDYWHVFRMRLFSNALAASIVPPFVVIMLGGSFARSGRANRALYLEVATLLVVLCAVSFAVFHVPQSAGEGSMYVYAPLPLLVWAAIRIGVGGVSASVAVLALLSITGTLRGTGPFALAGPEMSVVSLQGFLIITASSLMLLAAAFAELREARGVALRRKERLDLALNAAHIGAWEWDLLTGRIGWRLAGDSGEVVASEVRSAAELLANVHPDDRGRMTVAMRAAREDGGVNEVECRFLCDARVRWIRALGKVQRDSTGRPQAMIGVCIDMTQQKQEEIQQRSQREKLAHLTRAATLGELSGALAHELSQPLAAMFMNAQAAQQELRRISPDMREIGAILTDIVADNERAAEVMTRMRALFPRDPAEMEQVHVADCIRSILALEHSELIARNVVVDLAIDPALPPVIGAPAQLQQVLLNLVANACEAMATRSGERRLHIAARSHAGEVRVEVSDNGAGVEDFARIFEPFYSTKKRGVGLGLAISRNIVAAHGGQLWGSNNALGGATFFISLPARVPQDQIVHAAPAR